MTKVANLTRVSKVGTTKKNAVAAQARVAIALIKSKKDEIAGDFYAIGLALVALDDKAVIAALGHPSFAALCDVELEMSAAQAARLMHVVKSFSRTEAKHLTAAKATALIDLAVALGGKTTAKGILARGTVHVPNVGAIDVKSADAAVIARAAKAARKKESTQGVHLSTADKATVARARSAMKRANVKSIVIEGIAASAATGGRIRVTGYIRDLPRIAKALSDA